MTLLEKIEASQYLVGEILNEIGPAGILDLDTAMRLNTLNAQSVVLLWQHITNIERQNELLSKLAKTLNGEKPDPLSGKRIKFNIGLALDVVKSFGAEECDPKTAKDLLELLADTHLADLEVIQGLDAENKVLLEKIRRQTDGE